MCGIWKFWISVGCYVWIFRGLKVMGCLVGGVLVCTSIN